jgi:hypothetical protein
LHEERRDAVEADPGMRGIHLDAGVPVRKPSDGVRHMRVTDPDGDEIAFARTLGAA